MIEAARNDGMELHDLGGTAVVTGWLVVRGRGPSGPFERDAEKLVEGKAVPMDAIELTSDASREAWSYVVHGQETLGTLVDLPTQHPVRHVYVRRD